MISDRLVDSLDFGWYSIGIFIPIQFKYGLFAHLFMSAAWQRGLNS